MRQEKIVIGIDASSKAIGLGIIKSGKLSFPGTSECFYPSKENTDAIERGNDLFNVFKLKFTKLSEQLKTKITKDDVAIILNAGYRPNVGAEDPIKFVEHRIMGLIMDLGWKKPIVIYDSQWMHNISIGDDIKRDVKKLQTIEFLFSNGLKTTISGLHKKTPANAGGKDNTYSFKMGTNHYSITDDESDALMAAWAYKQEMLSDKQVATFHGKKKIAKQESIASQKKKLKAKIEKTDAKMSEVIEERKKYVNLYNTSGNKRDFNAAEARSVLFQTLQDEIVKLKKELETLK